VRAYSAREARRNTVRRGRGVRPRPDAGRAAGECDQSPAGRPALRDVRDDATPTRSRSPGASRGPGAFLEVVDRTDHDWKSVSYAVGNTLQCWEHQGPSSPSWRTTPTSTTPPRRSSISWPTCGRRRNGSPNTPSRRIRSPSSARTFTELERCILPEEYDQFDLFTDEGFEYPSFNVFESSADIVDAILETVDPETADDVAVVLDSNSRYSSLVESAFEAVDVPYYGGPGFVDDPHHRSLLCLCRTAFRGRRRSSPTSGRSSRRWASTSLSTTTTNDSTRSTFRRPSGSRRSVRHWSRGPSASASRST